MRDIINVSDLDGNEQSYQIAGLGSRTYAYTIDFIIKIGLLVLWCQLAGLLWQADPVLMTAQFLHDSDTTFAWQVLGPPLGIWLGYTVCFEVFFKGMTPGRALVGIRCITLRGRAPAFYAILLRNLFRLIDILPGTYLVAVFLLFFTNNQVRLGDMIAGTILIHHTPGVKKGGHSAMRAVILDPEQHQYLGELLDRWDTMKMDRRVQLARDFLRTIGKEVPEGLIDETIDRALHTQLRAIRKH